MRHPHIARLRYRLEPIDDTSEFDNPPAVERQTDAFYMRLDDEIVQFSMREHHETEANARERVEMYLRGWEISAALQYGGRPEFRFVFEDAEILDLDPPPPPLAPPPGTPQTVHLSAAAVAVGAASATIRVTRRSYPRPPDDFELSEDVGVMWSLYDSYRQGHDRLLPMAYTCLSRLEYAAGGRKQTAQRYRVDKKVLDKLGELTSTLGTGVEARKLDRRSKDRAPTAAEKLWIETVVRLLIRRAGEVAHDAQGSWPMITMGNLPDP
jgi:hypothetical protein